MKRFLIITFSLLLSQPGFAPSIFAAEYQCPKVPEILIRASNNSMVEHICDAADRAVHFLGNYQLRPQRTIPIWVISKRINQNGYMAYGSYDRKADQIRMMSLDAILSSREPPKMYDMAFDKEHYIGAVAHEITHAIFQHSASDVEEKWNNAAHEYIAHATQLGVLSEAKRDEVIHSEGTGPWESGDEISVTYMGFNTRGFAVKSYLHLTQQAEPQKFINLLLNHKWLYISVP